MRELLSNNSLFVAVGQLYEDKSLALPSRDLIFFTTDLQTVNYDSTIHALELIYFLNNSHFVGQLYEDKSLSAIVENWKNLKTSNVFSLFIVC